MINTNSVQFFKSINDKTLPKDCKIIVAAWHLSNPENIGKIIRLAHNIGAEEALFIKSDEKYRISKVKRTAGFSFEQMKWDFITEEFFLNKITSNYSLCILETCDHSTNVFHTELPNKLILLAGSESHGIPQTIIQQSKHKVYIPMPGNCKSLNVCNALSVACFEWYRKKVSL